MHKKYDSRTLFVVFCLLTFVGAAGSRADLVWDGGVAGSWADGGSGWLDGVTPATWNNAAPDHAVFGGTAPTTVSVASGGVTVSNMTFSAGNYTINGPGTVTLSNSTIQVGSSLVITSAAGFAGTTGFTKTGDGTLVLSGANKSYTGTTVINDGVVQVSAVGANVLGSASNAHVTLNGGALYANFSGNSAPSWVFNIGASGGEIRNTGAGRWQMNQADRFTGTGTVTLAFGSVNTRYELTAAQSSFGGKWVFASGGNNNRFFDIYSGFNPGTATGDDVITLDQASLLVRDGVTLGNASQGITLINGLSRIGIAGGNTGTIAGKISGTVGNNLEISLGSATSVAILSNTNNSWMGNTILRTDAGSGDVRGTVRLGASGVIPDAGGNVTINTGVVLDMNGFDETIGGIDGAGRILSSTGNAVLTLGSNNNSPTFTGTIADGGGTVSLVKTGSGIQSLAGTNTYSGNTTISSGTLKLNATGSISNSPVIYVASGATVDVAAVSGGFRLASGQTLTGNGTVVGSLRLQADATLSPGDSPGILNMTSLTLADTSRVVIDINDVTTAGVDYDRVQGSGSLTYEAGWILQVNFGASIAGTHTINLMDFSGYSGTANAPTIEFLNESGAASASYDTTNGSFTFTDAYIVPEPSSALLIGLGGLLFAGARRLRRRS